MKATCVGLMLLVWAVPCFAQDAAVAPKSEARDVEVAKPVASNHELLRKYVWATLGLEGSLHATLASGLDQWQKSPPEWATSATGYQRRWASAYAETVIGDTTKYAVARLFHHDPSFTRCQCSGFAKRLHHAVGSPFMARRRNGTRVLSGASLAGFLAGNVVPATTWYPAPGGLRDGLKHTASAVVGKMAIDVFREFGPRRFK